MATSRGGRSREITWKSDISISKRPSAFTYRRASGAYQSFPVHPGIELRGCWDFRVTESAILNALNVPAGTRTSS